MIALLSVLTGCVGQTTTPSSSPSAAPSVSSSPSATDAAPATPATPAAPTLNATGSAADNLGYFNLVNSTFLAPNPMPGGRPIIDNLVAAGFSKELMQVTPDKTTIGRDVDSVQFSVRFGASCLVGSVSPTGYVGVAGPAVSGALCLIGNTRAIDW